MSALGHKQTSRPRSDYVRFTPESGHRGPACYGRTQSIEIGRGLSIPASGSWVETKLQSVCLFKQPQGLFHVVGLFPQRFRIPFASLGSKEIASVNVNGSGQTCDRVGHRMNDVVSERLRILLAKRSRTRRFNL